MTSRKTLFQDHPLDGQAKLNGETLTSPYHVYDGTLLLVGGTVEARTSADLLAEEGLAPLTDDAGRALAAVWIADFTDANLGPHHELQISLFVTPRALAPVKAHPFAVLRAFTSGPPAQMMCHGLWNSTERVVRYNREHLCLNAALSPSTVTHEHGYIRFRFPAPDGGLIAEGRLSLEQRQSSCVLWQIMRHVGIGRTFAAARRPYLTIPVVGTRGPAPDRNLISETHSCGERHVIRLFGPQDQLAIHHPVYQRLGFRPDFIQRIERLGFVFGRPGPWKDRHAAT